MKDVVEFPRNGDRPSPPPLEPPKLTNVAVLTITLRSDGSITFQGPIENTMLCFGMLGEAHKILTLHDRSTVIKS